MTTNLPSRRLTDALASLRLGVVLIVALAGVCAVATVYESRHGTAAAQRDFYQTGWFAALLAALGLNILFAVLKKYPWKRRQAGFLMAHAGILVLLAGSLLSLHRGLDGSLALYEGEEGDRVSLPGRALQVVLPGHEAHGSFPIDLRRTANGQRLALPGSAASVVVEETLPHAEVSEGLEEGLAGSPALHFVLQGSFGRQDAWLLAGDPSRSHLDFGPVLFDLHAAARGHDAHGEEGSPSANRLAFTAAPDGSLGYVLTSRKGPGSRGVVALGRPIPTPWMGMEVVVDQFLPNAVAARKVTAFAGPVQKEARVPALRVRLEGPGARSEPEWVVWNEVREVAFGGGQARLAFRAPEAPLPFRVRLLDFRSEKYPGSERAATYESRVRVEDPEQGVSEHLVSMNHPLRHRGYVFFQASFVEGTPMMSVLSVARAPGLPLVYLGTALISLGLAWMFYVKPWLLGRPGLS
jgi:hypothetical protein